jgi:hypothetical protein
MPYSSREKLLAWRATDGFKRRNYERIKAWRSRPENNAKRAAQAQRWRERHPELWREIKERHRTANIETIRERDRVAQSSYRQTEQYKEASRVRVARFKAKQTAEREAIAGRPKPEVCELCFTADFRIVWDHCHVGGHFRGWICDRCNRVLGLVKDDSELLERMSNYLLNGVR